MTQKEAPAASECRSMHDIAQSLFDGVEDAEKQANAAINSACNQTTGSFEKALREARDARMADDDAIQKASDTDAWRKAVDSLNDNIMERERSLNEHYDALVKEQLDAEEAAEKERDAAILAAWRRFAGELSAVLAAASETDNADDIRALRQNLRWLGSVL